MELFNVLALIISGVGVPAVGYLFSQFANIKKSVIEAERQAEKDIREEREKRQQLELMVYRDYVSQVALEKIMAPINKDMANMERMIERIANKLVIPAVHDE